jgi:hypothetical protein
MNETQTLQLLSSVSAQDPARASEEGYASLKPLFRACLIKRCQKPYSYRLTRAGQYAHQTGSLNIPYEALINQELRRVGAHSWNASIQQHGQKEFLTLRCIQQQKRVNEYFILSPPAHEFLFMLGEIPKQVGDFIVDALVTAYSLGTSAIH